MSDPETRHETEASSPCSVASTSVSSQQDQPRRRHWRVELAPLIHSCLWFFHVAIYIATGGACLFTVLTYTALLTYKSGYTIEYVGALSVQYIPLVIVAYGVGGVLCLRSLFKQAMVSFKLRRLAFYGEARSLPKAKPRPNKHGYLRCVLDSCWTTCCTRAGFCGVDSEYFDLLFLQREAVEVVLQTYQCYRASWLLSQTWLNHVYVGTLVINCWGTPLLLKLAKRDKATLRLWCLVADVVLDFIAAVVIPIAIVKQMNADPRAVQHIKPGVVYLFDVPFDDVYLIELLLAVKQVICMNWLDLVSKLMPIYCVISCLNKIQLLAHRRGEAPASQLLGTTAAQIAPTPLASVSLLSRKTSSSTRLRAHSATDSMHAIALRTSTMLHRSQPLLLLWGLVVLVFHILAISSSRTASPEARLGCKSVVYPWLVPRFACSVLEINCVERNLTGSGSEIDLALSQLEPRALSSLIITHCSALTVPPRLQTLSNLIGLEITNASSVYWGEEAALHDANHNTLHFLSLVRVNITAIPEGLLAEDFPHALRDIHIVATNLSHVPDDLDLLWRGTLNLYLERNQLTSVPETVARMHVERLSLMGNAIHSIPDESFDGNAFHVLSLARNPLKSVPASIGSRADLKGVVLDDTLVETLPQWLLDASAGGAVTVMAAGTPFCIDGQANTTSFVCQSRPDDEFEAYAFTQNLKDRVAVPTTETQPVIGGGGHTQWGK